MFKIGQEHPAQSTKCMQILTSVFACLNIIWPLIISACSAHLTAEDVLDLRIALKKILKEIKQLVTKMIAYFLRNGFV